MLRTFRPNRIAILALLTMNLLLGAAWARNERVLYSFCPGGYPCTDGAQPWGGIVLDKERNIYGTASWGGAYDGGVVFKVTPSGKETVLYSFCSQSGCADGDTPLGVLVFDAEGNLYGTTATGGNNDSGCSSAYGAGCGVVFKVTPSGEETVLYAFTGPPDGATPVAGLVFDKGGNLYGTTAQGGVLECEWGCGVVFKIDTNGKETVVYSFCSESGCADGTGPSAGLVLGRRGNLYGTTEQGGYYGNDCAGFLGCGTAFRLTPSGEETVLHAFTGYPDGAIPVAGLVWDKDGNLYGTTELGGNAEPNGPGAGTVFKVTLSGKETVLHSFCSRHDCTDGAAPFSKLVFDGKRNMYGTTLELGGNGGNGVAFKLTLSGKDTVLHAFTGESGGYEPAPGLVFDKRGNLYGPTYDGGDYNAGTVFKLTR